MAMIAQRKEKRRAKATGQVADVLIKIPHFIRNFPSAQLHISTSTSGIIGQRTWLNINRFNQQSACLSISNRRGRGSIYR